ncbi:MAG: VOC family protein [Frankiales bacterium]|nr:VOC family protein [Frankiales bacterium]
MQLRLELVPLAVSDPDAAKAWYVNRVGFTVAVDVTPREGMRIVQLTPPGSSCSVVFGAGMRDISDQVPGSTQALHLVTDDIRGAREQLRSRGVDVQEVEDMGGVLFASFADPDGNSWLLQEFPAP